MERDRAAKSTRKYLQLAKDDAPEVDREALPRTGGWADCGESVEKHMTSALLTISPTLILLKLNFKNILKLVSNRVALIWYILALHPHS